MKQKKKKGKQTTMKNKEIDNNAKKKGKQRII